MPGQLLIFLLFGPLGLFNRSALCQRAGNWRGKRIASSLSRWGEGIRADLGQSRQLFHYYHQHDYKYNQRVSYDNYCAPNYHHNRDYYYYYHDDDGRASYHDHHCSKR
jgi:hypothetical protein